ncbi:MAG: PAS domain-containing sensor histidine kinase [Thermodesulfobacteriota bacterium]
MVRQAEALLRVLPNAIFIVDAERRIIGWNDAAVEITGYTQEEVVGKECATLSLCPCSFRCPIFDDAMRESTMSGICELRAKGGEIRLVSRKIRVLRGADGKVVGAVESFKDVTEQQNMERQLRTERDKFRGILSALDQGMHILNRDFIIEYQNDILQRIFGDKLGEKCYRVYKQRDLPCEVCRMHAAIEHNAIQRTEETMADGRQYEQSYVPFADIDGRVKVLILLRDITEEKAYRAETMRAGQLASIGELAAGVAHEINNPINGIINYAQVLLDESSQIRMDARGDRGISRDMLARIIKEGERIAYIVRNLLFFARQRDEEAEVVQLGMVIEDSLSLIRHQMQKDGIAVEVDVPEGLPLVRVNPQQLQQVFLNLLSNARHALNQRYPGRDPNKRVEIRCAAILHQEADWLRVRITDRGSGIPRDIIAHIFEPFFSSKKPGEGTGLGLSISQGLVRDSHGELTVESAPGEYTTMIVDLPAVGE